MTTEDRNSSEGGLTRRQVLARGAVAGGVVWSAPLLLSSPAGAQAMPACCGAEGELMTTIKISSTPSNNCGVSALSSRGQYNYPCLGDLAACLQTLGYIVVSEQYFENGQVRSAQVTLKGGIKAISVGLKSTNDLYFSDCNTYCPNLTSTQGQPSATQPTSQLPIKVYRYNQVTGCGTAPAGTDLGTAQDPYTVIDIVAPKDKQGRDDPINHMEMSICIPTALTGLCP